MSNVVVQESISVIEAAWDKKSRKDVLAPPKDTLFPVHMAQEVADSIPNSKLVVILFAGHTLNLEAIPQMVKAMKEFILAN